MNGPLKDPARTSVEPAPLAGIDEGKVVTYSRRGLHGRILDVLGHRLVSGQFKPGAAIEPDVLVVELGVSRTVVREAIKVLSAKGLLDARPRRGTFALPRERWNLLDADVIRWRNSGSPDPRLMVELEEVRQMIEPWGARLAAERRLPAHLEVLESAFEQMTQATDDALRVSADLRFHRAILAAAQNELLEHMAVVLEPALVARDELAFKHAPPAAYDHALKAHGTVLACIHDGRADDAFLAMTDLVVTAAADTKVNLGYPPNRRGDREEK